MTEPFVHIDSSEKRADLPEDGDLSHCPKCGAMLEQGFGLAGGGVGPYKYCHQHGVVAKTVLPPEGEE